MAWIDWVVGVGIILFAIVYSYNLAASKISSSFNLIKIFDLKTVAFSYFKQLFGSLGEPANWNSANFNQIGLMNHVYRIPILVRENAGLARTNEVVDLRIEFDEDCKLKAWNSTLRLIKDNQEIPFSLYNITYCTSNYLKEANLVFFANASANSSNFYFLYFSPDKEIKPVSYESDLSYDGNYLQNSKIKLNLTGEISEIYNLETSSANLLSQRKFGIVQYNATTNSLVETNETSGTKSLIVDSNFKKVVEISGTTDWFDYKLEVILYAFQNYFIVKPWVKEKIDIILDDFKNPEAYLYSPFETIAFRNDTGIYTSSNLKGNVPNASWIAPYNSTSADSLALLTTNYTAWKQAGWNNYGNEISYSHLLNEYDTTTLSITAGQEFEGNKIFVFPFKSNSYSEVEDFWRKISNPLEVKVYPQQKFLAISVSKLKELKKVDYEEAVKSLGGYDFNIEIAE